MGIYAICRFMSPDRIGLFHILSPDFSWYNIPKREKYTK
jgi:hypothetical protein